MNFIEEFKKGQAEGIIGIPFGESLESITMDTNGIHRGRIYAVGGPEKSGKTTFVDYAFVMQAYLYALNAGINLKWIYYSFEIDRVSKEFDFVTYFLHMDHGVTTIALPEGVLRNGETRIKLSPDYLRGFLMDDEFKSIKIHPDLVPLIKDVYEKRIIPLFGEFSQYGHQIKKGLITFIEHRDNPTGLYKSLKAEAEKEGVYHKDDSGYDIGYTPNDPKSFRIVIIDHIRKLKPERNWQIKQTIDKMSEYMVVLRNLLGYTFVPIVHTNRGLTSADKINHLKGDIFPSSDSLKDSGNIGEDCNYLLTTFNPNDDNYALKEHFGFKVRDSKGNILHPNFKTIHLASSRHCEFPRHYKINMLGNLKKFEKIN